jgi:rhamnose utilization protein RhaD (predicted bifunctional aldolase and dehydrogenase)
MLTRAGTRLSNLWDGARAAGMSEPEKLLYRSNLLGSDKRITNYGGGNTSAKVMERDPLTGEPVEVLWVKGSGGDVGSIRMDGFATLYMDRLSRAEGPLPRPRARGRDGGLPAPLHLQPQPRAASIDTPLHAFVPRAHVDHMHPDAIIAIAASADSRALTRRSSATRSAGCRGSVRASNWVSGSNASAPTTRTPRA